MTGPADRTRDRAAAPSAGPGSLSAGSPVLMTRSMRGEDLLPPCYGTRSKGAPWPALDAAQRPATSRRMATSLG